MDDLKRYLIEETVEDYAEGRINRREAMATLVGLTGAALGAQLLAACGNKGDKAATGSGSASASGSGGSSAVGPASSPDSVKPDDPDVVAGAVEFAGDGAKVFGYRAAPSRAGTFPIVLVCHENRGLTAHIE